MEALVIRLVCGASISFLITYYLVPLLCRIAQQYGIMDIPDGTIKCHKEPTPYLGGVAVFLGFLVSLAFVFPVHNHMMLIVIGLTLLLFLGLLDDLIQLRASQKLFGQALAAFCFLRAGFYLKTTFFLAGKYNALISLFWIATVVNAFNLVDVMDGLATTLAVCATGSFLCLALMTGQYTIAVMLAPFFGALCGFLWYNKPKARIYLGDTGSLVIGGFLAVIPFLFNWGLFSPYGFLAPLIILAIPLLEVATLIVVRTSQGIPFYNASGHHFCMFLRSRRRWSATQILAYVAGMSVVLFAVSCLVMLNYVGFAFVALSGVFFLISWFGTLIGFKEAK